MNTETEPVLTPDPNGHHIKHIHIQGFKGFSDLEITQLAQVNLITGKNNTGKTSLLEGVYLGISGFSKFALHSIFKYKVYGNIRKLRVDNLKIADSFFNKNASSFSIFVNRIAFSNSEKTSNSGNMSYNLSGYLVKKSEPDFLRYINDALQAIDNSWYSKPEFYELSVDFIGSEILRDDFMLNRWEKIVLKPSLEQKVLEMCQKFIPKAIKLVPAIEESSFTFVVDDDTNFDLREFGYATRKALLYALTIAYCKDGVVFIDEIGEGVHYSEMPDFLDKIITMCKLFNVQLFATTHSSDCVRAFAQKSLEYEEVTGQVIRLYRSEAEGNPIRAAYFTEDEMLTAIDHDIEMR